MAREFSYLHEELRTEVLEEVLKRIPSLPREGQHRMILYLSGWLLHFDLQAMQEDNMLTVLHSLVLLTSYYSEQRTDLLAQMWTSLGASASNVTVIVNFMIETITVRVS